MIGFTSSPHKSKQSNRTAKPRRWFRPWGERLEERLPLAGVTVITHGALPSLFGLLPFPNWPIAMGEAILDQADGDSTTHSTGSIYIHDQTSGLWKSPADAGVMTSWTNSNSADDEIVLIYVWQVESLSPVNGMAEAAADSLFASLFQENTQLDGTVKNQRFVKLADRGNGELDLHLIGHSRGAVVNTLVTERFANYFPTWTIDQVTSLDAHPAKNPFQSGSTDPYYNANEANIRLPTFENVVFADAYYRTATEYQSVSTLDFSGVAVDGANNVDLTPLLEANAGNDRDDPTKTLDGNGLSLEHSDVHLWYQSTIQDTGTVSDGDIVNFDPDAAGWFPTTSRSSMGFAFSRIANKAARPVATTNKSAAPSLRTTIYNGDFAFGADTGNTIPGWQYHGGDHDADLSSGAVMLGNSFFGDRDFIRHNVFYIPATSDTLAFDYQVTDASSDDRLEVRLGDKLIDVPPIVATGSFHREVVIPDELRNAANVLEFRLRATAKLNSKLTLDNISLATGASVDFRVTTLNTDAESLASGDTFSTTYDIANQGNRASSVGVQWYLSRDRSITTDDRPISSKEVVILSPNAASGPRSISLTLPRVRDPIWAGDGIYFIGIIVDPEQEIAEVDEANNSNQGDGIDLEAIAVTNATGPLLMAACGRGFIFSDLNVDDVFSPLLDDAISGVEVRLLLGADRSVATTTETNDNGFYEFADVPAGNYIISVDRPAAFGNQASVELSVTIVTDPGCENADVDLGRLQASFVSPQLFLASNRIGTAARAALLKRILDQAEDEAPPLHVNSEAIAAVIFTATEPSLETIAEQVLPTLSEAIAAEDEAEVKLAAAPVAVSLAGPQQPESSDPPIVIHWEAESLENSRSFDSGESPVASTDVDECEMDVADALPLAEVDTSRDEAVIEKQDVETTNLDQHFDTEPEPVVFIYGPDPPSSWQQPTVDRHAAVFAEIESLVDECLFEQNARPSLH